MISFRVSHKETLSMNCLCRDTASSELQWPVPECNATYGEPSGSCRFCLGQSYPTWRSYFFSPKHFSESCLSKWCNSCGGKAHPWSQAVGVPCPEMSLGPIYILQQWGHSDLAQISISWTILGCLKTSRLLSKATKWTVLMGRSPPLLLHWGMSQSQRPQSSHFRES